MLNASLSSLVWKKRTCHCATVLMKWILGWKLICGESTCILSLFNNEAVYWFYCNKSGNTCAFCHFHIFLLPMSKLWFWHRIRENPHLWKSDHKNVHLAFIALIWQSWFHPCIVIRQLLVLHAGLAGNTLSIDLEHLISFVVQVLRSLSTRSGRQPWQWERWPNRKVRQQEDIRWFSFFFFPSLVCSVFSSLFTLPSTCFVFFYV